MNKSKATLAGVTAMAALGGLTLSACGSSNDGVAKNPAPVVSNSASASTAAPSPSATATKKVSRDEHRSPVASPTSTSKAPALKHVASPSATAPALKTVEKPTIKAAKVTKAAPAPTTTKAAPKTVVNTKTWSNTKTLAQPSAVYVNDSTLAKGKTKVISQGHPGTAKVQYKRTLVNGVSQGTKAVDSDVISSPKASRIAVGTYVAPAKKQAPKPVVRSAQVAPTKTYAAKATPAPMAKKSVTRSKPSAAPAMANEAMWDKIAQCESGGNWSINSGNGYNGGLQFDRQTWIGAGGGAYAPTANLATKAQQIDIANKVYAQRGLQPWACGYAAR